MFKNKKGGVTAGTIVMLSVGFLLVAILTPIGMREVVGANTTDWQDSVITIFQVLLPILYIVGVAIRYVPGSRSR